MAAKSIAPTHSYTSRPPKTTSTTNEDLIIRQARLQDGAEIGRIAAKTYLDTPLSAFLAPKRHQYYSHWERGFIQRAQKRLFEPRNLTFVVVAKDNPNLPVGYAAFIRLGDDEGAKRQIERDSLLNRVVSRVLLFLYSAWCWIVLFWTGGDKSEDKKAMALFEGWGKDESKRHWDSFPERKSRWHAQSVCIREEYQGRKAGKKLMAEVIARAEEENVVVGLESSAEGEFMYRSVGFELLGRYAGGNDIEQGAGGVMMYTPRARR